MNENDGPGSGSEPRPDFAHGVGDPAGSLRKDRTDAASTVSDASNAARDEAKKLAAQGQRLAGEQAEKVKEAAVSHLDVFADSLRAASEELGRNQSGPAADMVSNAASGLEGLTRSLHGRSTGEMIDTVRNFGRENPIAFLAGSVLAGLALGRIAAAATTPTSPPTGEDKATMPPEPPYVRAPGAAANMEEGR